MDKANPELPSLMREIAEWSDKTFGVDGIQPINRAIPILNHLKKEISELIEATQKMLTVRWYAKSSQADIDQSIAQMHLELADVMILILDFATKVKVSPYELLLIIDAKLLLNHSRKWGKADENGVVHHIKENPDQTVMDFSGDTI